MENLVYLVVGLLIGAVIGVLLGLVCRKNPAITRTESVSDKVICGACKSPILEPPMKVVITDHDSFRYFRCRQCGTDVTAPLPS